MILAGVEFSRDVFIAANAAIREAIAISNPIAVAEFFYHVYKAIFDGLFASNIGHISILSNVSNYYGVVETNSYGILYLYTLV